MIDPLDRLKERDPVRALPEPEPDMVLFERLVATPPAPPRARRPHARRAVVVATRAVVVAAVIVAVAGLESTGDSSMDLAAKAYAEAAPNANVVTHSVS